MDSKKGTHPDSGHSTRMSGDNEAIQRSGRMASNTNNGANLGFEAFCEPMKEQGKRA